MKKKSHVETLWLQGIKLAESEGLTGDDILDRAMMHVMDTRRAHPGKKLRVVRAYLEVAAPKTLEELMKHLEEQERIVDRVLEKASMAILDYEVNAALQE